MKSLEMNLPSLSQDKVERACDGMEGKECKTDSSDQTELINDFILLISEISFMSFSFIETFRMCFPLSAFPMLLNTLCVVFLLAMQRLLISRENAVYCICLGIQGFSNVMLAWTPTYDEPLSWIHKSVPKGTLEQQYRAICLELFVRK